MNERKRGEDRPWGDPLRPTSSDAACHVLNRANARRTLFEDHGNYAAFERGLGQACE